MNTKTKTNNFVKVIDGVIILINIASNIALFFIMGDILNGFTYANNLSYNFTTIRYIEIGIFLIAQISGIYLTVKCFLNQKLKGRLLIVTIPLTILFIMGLWLFYNAPNININSSITFSDISGITQGTYASIGLEYVIISILVYALLLYDIYSVIFKKSSIKKVTKTKKYKK